MIENEIPIFLASASPRRKKLLKQIGLRFKTFSVDLNEEFSDGEHPVKTVKRLASDKLSLAKEKVKDGIIITADTIVVLNGKILGKPKDKKDAVRMLKMLSGKTHSVYTGYAVFNSINGKLVLSHRRTAVTFRKLTDKEIVDYVAGGSPLDKAGSYGIQDDYGAVFVKEIKGCYYNVVGLPLSDVYQAILDVLP
jgi:septum formation protein